MDLQIHFHPVSEGAQRVSLAGRLDTDSYAEFDRQLAPVLESGRLRSLVLDLADLDYISSAGVRSILKARKALAPHRGKVVIANPQPQIQKVFDIVRAVPMDEIFASVAEADAYLDNAQRKVLQGDSEEDEE